MACGSGAAGWVLAVFTGSISSIIPADEATEFSRPAGETEAGFCDAA